ncbi:MAG: ATP-binding protein [Chitinophagales bacterium]
MKFSDIIGHQHIKEYITKSVRSGKVSHAQLFLGPKGNGNLALALAVAQYANCLKPTEIDSCGKCRSCLKSKKFIHPDIHYSYPTIGSKATSNNFLKDWRVALAKNPYLNVYEWLQHIKAEKKQGNITKDECHQIIHKLSFKANEGKYKVLIMWQPEYLGKEGNRLLKLIEEPPPNTLFILVAHQQDLILNTILSRTQLLRVPRLPDEEIETALQQKYQISMEKAKQIAILAEGNINKALNLIGSADNDNQQLLLNWIGACQQQQIAMMLQYSEHLATLGRENQKNFLAYCLYFLRQTLLVKMMPTKMIALAGAEKQLAKQIATSLKLDGFDQIFDMFNKASAHIERNANARITFLYMSSKLGDILKQRK